MQAGGRLIVQATGSLWRFGCGLEGHLAHVGSHLVVRGAAESQHHAFLGTSWAHLGPSWLYVGASWGLVDAKIGLLGPMLALYYGILGHFGC